MPVSGASEVKVDCWIGLTGLLSDCKLLSETPPGTGMGAFEVKALPLDRFAVFTEEGFPSTGMKVGIDTRPDTKTSP